MKAYRKGFSYTYPVTYDRWAEGFMAGNGRQGIIVFGNPRCDTVIFTNRNFNLSRSNPRTFNKVSKDDLEKIKMYLIHEQWKEANELADKVHGWKDGGDGNRHPGYKMIITLPDTGEISDYIREINYETGEIIIRYVDKLGVWERKSFVSRKDDVVVQYMTASDKCKLTATFELDIDAGMNFPQSMIFNKEIDTNYMTIRVKYPAGTNDSGYEGVTRVITDGGVKEVNGNKLIISEADSILLLTKTSKYKNNSENEWKNENLKTALDIICSDYQILLQDNIKTHGEIYNRVKINLGGTSEDRALSNEELIAKQKKSKAMIGALYERVFDAGRFYFLCSSGSHETPDLLGNWTGDCNVGWNGYYHLDANLNLQIAGGNIGNMPEAMEGYFWLIEQWKEDFKINADKLLGVRGMLAAGNSPGASSGLISALSYYYPYQYVTGEMAWLLYPFWEYYLITGDMDFLHERLYPLLREMADFYEDFLTETDKNDKFIFAGSISPETQPAGLKCSLVNNSVFDIAGARFILKTLIKTYNIIGNEPDTDVVKWQTLYNKLPAYIINEDGALAEWVWPGFGETYEHRHSSGLVPVWPYREITFDDELNLYTAAKETLKRKDKGIYETAGHGILHAALIGANLHESGSIARKLHQLLVEDYYFGSLMTSHYNNNKVFCTDVLHTVPAIIIEMLIISDEGVLELLPALPDDFPKGFIEGVKGKSRFTIERLSFDMNIGEIICELTSDIDQILTIIYRKGIASIKSDYGDISESLVGKHSWSIRLRQGVRTRLLIMMKK